MKRKKWIFGSLGIIVIAVLGVMFLSSPSNSDQSNDRTVTVERGTIVEKALAVGTIEPENEIQVKSKISGVVSRIYAEPGTFVRHGEPIIEIQPDPTPLELAEAKRNVELAEVELENLEREMNRNRQLRERGLISDREFEELQKRYNDSTIRLQMRREHLELLESGRVTIGDTKIESLIKAPITGFILEKMVEVGDPVVPLTSYQAGTALVSMAAMENLLFKGTVDEIDVGKMKEGMPVEIKVGAIPDAVVNGTLSLISLKAHKQDNATVFPVEIAIEDNPTVTLRAGYSANADVIITRKEDILIVPERIVTFKNGDAFVDMPDGQGGRKQIQIKTGLSDAINIEVTEGLNEGDIVLEKPIQRLTVR
jgi:HlyD family secretion protein